MKRILACALACFMLFSFAGISLAEVVDKLPETAADAHVVMDAKTGQVLVSKNKDKREYPASITKIMTAALTLELGNINDTTTVTYADCHEILADSTHIALTEGEVVPVKDLLYAMMLESANDAANALATYVSGSHEAFVELMNQKLKEIGANNSHFVNANGLPDDDHYVTAYDMALITKYALGVEGFREVFGGISYTMAPTNKQPKERNFGTYHYMIVESAYEYPGATGGKLGWTEDARHTIATVASQGDTELICIGLKTINKWDKYKDSTALYDYCFSYFQPVSIKKAKLKLEKIPVYQEGTLVGYVKYEPKSDINLLLHMKYDANDLELAFNAPAQYDSPDGIKAPSVTVSIKGGAGDTMENVLLTQEIEYVYQPLNEQETMAIKQKEKATGVWAIVLTSFKVVGLTVLIFLGFALLLLVLLVILRNVNISKRRKKKREDFEKARAMLPKLPQENGEPQL